MIANWEEAREFEKPYREEIERIRAAAEMEAARLSQDALDPMTLREKLIEIQDDTNRKVDAVLEHMKEDYRKQNG